MPIASIEIDDQTVSGIITPDYHHWGRDWLPEFDATNPYAVRWISDDAEYIPAMKAIAPRQIVSWSDMALSDWTVTAGTDLWFENKPAVTKPRVKFLHFRQAEIGSAGRVISTATYRPGIYIRALRFVPVDGETAVPRLRIELDGGTGEIAYGLDIPWGGTDVADAAFAVPKLYQGPSGTAFDLDAPFATMAESTGQMTTGSEVLVQDISIEQLGEFLMIRLSNVSSPWIVKTGVEDALVSSTVAISFTGHCGMFNVQPIQWPATATTKPQQRHEYPTWVSEDVQYRWVGSAPTGTTVSVVEDTAYGATRPFVTFATTGSPQYRPLLYNVQMWTEPTITAPEYDPQAIAPIAVSWQRDNSWRGANFSAEYRDCEVPVRPNMQAELKIGWATAETRITGYVRNSTDAYSGDRYSGAVREPTLAAYDHISARLSEAKWMRHMPDFALWEAGALFTFLLNTAGVDDAYIYIDAGVAVDPLPQCDPPWERRWAFDEQTGIVQAMDAIFTDFWGLQWGWGPTGYFLRAKPTYTGTPDWTIDPTTQYVPAGDPEDPMAPEGSPSDWMRQIVTRLNINSSIEDMRNYVMVRDEAGNAYFARDVASHTTLTAANYVGDDRWDMLQSRAVGAADAATMAAARLAEVSHSALQIEIETEYDGVGPDDFVLITSHADPLIADNSVYRIVSEAGTATADDMQITYTCIFDSIQEA